jgi:hypothetical protein
MSDWVVGDNPAYGGMTPRPLKPACHDGSPCIDIICTSCGGTLHQHESRTKSLPLDAEVGCPCPYCHEVLVFPPGFFAEAFTKLREDGWVE